MHAVAPAPTPDIDTDIGTAIATAFATGVRAAPRVAPILKSLGISAFLLLAPLAYSTPVDYVRNFEEGLELNCSGNCPSVSDDVAREGSRAMRSQITKNSDGNTYRAEVVIPGRAKNLQYDVDYWYGFSSFLPLDWEVNYKNELIAQFHSALDPGDDKVGPPVAIRSGREGDWEILSRAEGDTRGSYRQWTLNSVWEDVGKWTDWVIHYRPSIGEKGVLRIWKDGALVVEHTGPNAMDDERGPYFKMGIYKPFWKNRDDSGQITKTIYHDALRIASGPQAGYFDVAPRDTPLVAAPEDYSVEVPDEDEESVPGVPVPTPPLETPIDTDDPPVVSVDDSYAIPPDMYDYEEDALRDAFERRYAAP